MDHSWSPPPKEHRVFPDVDITVANFTAWIAGLRTRLGLHPHRSFRIGLDVDVHLTIPTSPTRKVEYAAERRGPASTDQYRLTTLTIIVHEPFLDLPDIIQEAPLVAARRQLHPAQLPHHMPRGRLSPPGVQRHQVSGCSSFVLRLPRRLLAVPHLHAAAWPRGGSAARGY